MPQTVRIQSPLKGVNRAFARESQPEGTCWDAVNVMPQDRYTRLRVAQRSGIGAGAVLDGTNPVRLLHVAPSARAFSAGSTTLVSDPFTYSNGDLGATANWNTYQDANPNVPAADAIVVASNKVTSGVGDYSLALAAGQLSVTLGTSYDMSIDFTMGGASGNFYEFELIAQSTAPTQFGQPSVDGKGIVLLVTIPRDGASASFLQFEGPGGTDFTLAGPVVTVSATHTLTLQRRGNTVTALIDGVSAFSTTSATIGPFSDNEGVGSYGFGIEGNDATLDPPTLDNYLITTPGAPATNIDRTVLNLVAVAGTTTYLGDPITCPAVANSGSFPVNSASIFVDAATLFGFTYIVDGTQKPLKLNLTTHLFVAFTESAGTAPSDASIACDWRGRLILSGSAGDPQNFYASRAGNPLDWDYSQTDPETAFVGNTAASGKIGQPIHALIPLTDDILVIGCEQSMWAVRGDPADGGSIDQITDFAGISQAHSWSRGPDGSIYFTGPRGFFKMNPTATEVQEISQNSYPQYFQGLNRSTNYINLIYDADRYGIWVYVSPLTQGNAATSIFYDFRFQGFWPQDFRNQLNAGPVSAIFWDGYDSDTRYPVLGGYDGTLYGINLTNRTDNGGVIVGTITLGPFNPQPGASVLTGVTANFGELSVSDASVPSRWQTSVSLFAGKTPFDATEGTPTSTGLIDWGRDRRTKTMRQRLRGEWFTIKLSNAAAGNYFSMESLELEFEAAGKNRRQR